MVDAIWRILEAVLRRLPKPKRPAKGRDVAERIRRKIERGE